LSEVTIHYPILLISSTASHNHFSLFATKPLQSTKCVLYLITTSYNFMKHYLSNYTNIYITHINYNTGHII
jgi:hypothetical protein